MAAQPHAEPAGVLREFDPFSLERGPDALERTRVLGGRSVAAFYPWPSN
jgi:hypothetical protein